MNFDIFTQGPLYRFFLQSRLVKKPLLLYQRRMLIICLLTWLPLLILTLFSKVRLSMFISDIDVHVRLLISLPLLLYAEVVANKRFQVVVGQFIKCHIVSKKDYPQYEAMIASAMKLSSSILVEIILFLFVITVGRWISKQVLPFDISMWYATKINNSVSLTLPGYWYAFVSLPIFQFILLRWYYRIIIWYRFLWQTSRLKLRLNSLHPDKAGGIGFLVNSIYGIEPFLIAHSVLLAGIILNSILNSNAILWQFKNEMIAWLIILVFIPLLPMTFFIRQLTRAKRDGTNEYDVVANQYVTDFRRKWIDTQSNPEETLLGTPDIQSLSDLSNSFAVSAGMRIFPLNKNAIFFILLFTALPFFPLIFTVIPLEKILSQVITIVFK